VAVLVVSVGSVCMVASPVVGVFEARGTIFNFQYAIADSAISPLTMTGGGGASTYPSTIPPVRGRTNKRGSRSCLPWSTGSSLSKYSWPP